MRTLIVAAVFFVAGVAFGESQFYTVITPDRPFQPQHYSVDRDLGTIWGLDFNQPGFGPTMVFPGPEADRDLMPMPLPPMPQEEPMPFWHDPTELGPAMDWALPLGE